MSLNADHLLRVVATLERSLMALKKAQDEKDELGYDMFRNSAVKSFELAMETSGKLLRKAIEPWMPSKSAAWKLTYKDLFRQAARHGLLQLDETERWLDYRDNRNSTAHDYGQHFAEDTLKILPAFIEDARRLAEAVSRD